MKLQKNTTKRTRKKIWILIILVIVLVAGSAAVYAFRDPLGLVDDNPSADEQYTAPTNEEEQLGEETTEQTSDNNAANNETNGTVPSDTPDQDNSESPYSIRISSINQNDTNLQIRTMITPLTTGGECTLSLGKAGEKTVTQTASVQNMPSYSTCQGFNIDTSTLANGSWSVQVSYEKDGVTAIANGTAVIQ